MKLNTRRGGVREPRRGKWRKPPSGFIKINCDTSASFDGCGIGVIGRDDHGEVVFFGSRRVQDSSSPEIAEAEAILWAVRCAIENEISHAVFESDCLVVVHALQNRKIDRCVLAVIIGNILEAAREMEFTVGVMRVEGAIGRLTTLLN